MAITTNSSMSVNAADRARIFFPAKSCSSVVDQAADRKPVSGCKKIGLPRAPETDASGRKWQGLEQETPSGLDAAGFPFGSHATPGPLGEQSLPRRDAAGSVAGSTSHWLRTV